MKKITTLVLAVLMVMSLAVSVSAYTDPTAYNYGYNYGYGYNPNYGYNNNYGYGYNYYNCTGIRTTYSDEEYQPSAWFDTYAEQYGVVFHLPPQMPISRSDVFAPIGKAMKNAYEDNGRNFSMSYGVPFVDFTWDSSLYDVAGGLYQRSIMSGYPEDNTVRFPKNITRAEFAKVLVVTAKQNGIYSMYNNVNSQFTDIEGHWAEQFINECNAMGLMLGKSIYEFAPEHTVTYEEFVTVMIRMAERTTNSSYAMDIDDVAYGISSTMDIDFEGYGYEEFDLAAYGSKTIYLETGETTQLKVKATPSDIELSKSDVKWEAARTGYVRLSNEKIEDDRYAVVTVKALKEGKVTVTATASRDEDVSVNYTIVISDEEYVDDDVNVTSIKVNPSAVELKVGESKSITATVYPTNAANKDIVWESYNEKVATVNQNGKITAVGIGTATITAKSEDDSSIMATIDVTVTAGNTSNDTTAPTVEITGANNVAVGQMVTLTVKVNEENISKFEITEKDLLGLTGGASINKIKKVSNDTYEITLMGVEVSALELCIDAGVATDVAGNVSAESNPVVIFINSGE